MRPNSSSRATGWAATVPKMIAANVVTHPNFRVAHLNIDNAMFGANVTSSQNKLTDVIEEPERSVADIRSAQHSNIDDNIPTVRAQHLSRSLHPTRSTSRNAQFSARSKKKLKTRLIVERPQFCRRSPSPTVGISPNCC